MVAIVGHKAMRVEQAQSRDKKTKGARISDTGSVSPFSLTGAPLALSWVLRCFVAASIVASCRGLRQSGASTCGQFPKAAARTSQSPSGLLYLTRGLFKVGKSVAAARWEIAVLP